MDREAPFFCSFLLLGKFYGLVRLYFIFSNKRPILRWIYIRYHPTIDAPQSRSYPEYEIRNPLGGSLYGNIR